VQFASRMEAHVSEEFDDAVEPLLGSEDPQAAVYDSQVRER
jgi:hypothetical protein